MIINIHDALYQIEKTKDRAIPAPADSVAAILNLFKLVMLINLNRFRNCGENITLEA